MGLVDWVATATGVALVGAVLVDVLLTVLHQDHEGPMARAVQRLTWAAARGLGRRLQGFRRQLHAMAGPVMLVATFAAWMAFFVLGVALVVWAHMPDAYASDREELVPLGFIDALYYSGITGTVLGYGDVTPVTASMKVVAFLSSGLGFALLTAIVTYLISTLNALGERNAVTLRLTQQVPEGDGITIICEAIADEEPAQVAQRIEQLTDGLIDVGERLHRFPLTSFYTRSLNPYEDPEPMFERLGEIAVAASLVAQEPRWHPVRPAARRLERALSHLIALLAAQHIDKKTQEQIAQPAPVDRDRRFVSDIAERLGSPFGRSGSEAGRDELNALSYRLRVFLDRLDQLTDWRASRP